MSLHPAQELVPFFGTSARPRQQVSGDLRRRRVLDALSEARAVKHNAIEWLKKQNICASFDLTQAQFASCPRQVAHIDDCQTRGSIRRYLHSGERCRQRVLPAGAAQFFDERIQSTRLQTRFHAIRPDQRIVACPTFDHLGDGDRKHYPALTAL